MYSDFYNLFLLHKNKIVIICIFLIILFISISIYLNIQTRSKINQKPPITPTIITTLTSITPTKRPGGGPQPDTDYFQIDEESVRKNKNLGYLLSNLPFKGEHFSLDYSYSELTYVLTINQNYREEGQKEFDEFLKLMNIENQSWLEDLKIIYN